MAIRIVQLGSPRAPTEGVRIGSVRRPPRGVRAADFARLNYYDVWLPLLAPSAALVGRAKAARTGPQWAAFVRAFRRELKESGAERTLDVLAALSKNASFSLGCYCDDEAHCHRSVLRAMLAERGALFAPEKGTT